MGYKKKYKEALERAREFQKSKDGLCVLTAESIFPELKESEDERIRKTLLESFEYQIKESYPDKEWICGVKLKEIVAWLEKQGESNPYSGVSFEYNGHTWGMCARDNGIDILFDKQLFKHLEKQGEKKPTWSDQDEENLQHCCGAVFAADYYTYEDKQDMEKWLLQLKERLS